MATKVVTPTALFSPKSHRALSALVFVIAAILLLPLLSLSPVFQVSEAREGVVVREMLSSGELVLPLRNGEIVPSKPVLFHWLGFATAKLAGQYQEFELRFPSALSATVCVLFTAHFAASIASTAAGLLAALILLSMYGFMHLAQDGRVDMLMNSLATAAIVTWLLAYWRERASGGTEKDIPRSTYLVCAFFVGLAVLAKGPLGILLPLLVIGAVSFIEERRIYSILRLEWLFALAICLPWYFVAAARGSEHFLGRQVIFENISRFIGGAGIVSKPAWFYLTAIWSQAAPWCVLFVVGAALLFVPRFRRVCCELLSDDARAVSFGMRSSLVWFLSMLLFFTLSSGKRRGYLLPILPAIALFLTFSLFYWWNSSGAESSRQLLAGRWGRTLSWIGSAVIVVLFVLLGLLIFGEQASLLMPNAVIGKELHETLRAFTFTFSQAPLRLILYFSLLVVASVWCWANGRESARPLTSALGAYCLLQLVFVVFVNTAVATKGVTHSYRFFAEQVERQIPPQAEILFVKKRLDESFDGFFFYFGRHVTMLSPKISHSMPGTYLARRRWLAERPDEWHAGVEILLEGGRRIDTPEEQLVLFRRK